MRPKQPEKTNPLKSKNVRDLSNPIINHAYLEKVNELLITTQEFEVTSNDCDDLIEKITTAASHVLQDVRPYIQKYPWNDNLELESLLESRKKYPRTANEYKDLTKTIKHVVTKLRNDHYENEAQAINICSIQRDIEKLYRRAKTSYNTLKPLRLNMCPPNELREHFKDHFNPTDNENPIELECPPPFVSILHDMSIQHPIKTETAPSLSEILNVLKRMKNGRSALDAPPELFKYARESPYLQKRLLALLSKIWEEKRVPMSWGKSSITSLWKNKGSAKDASKYRVLCLSSVLLKIMIAIILIQLDDWYIHQITPKLCGFVKNRGTKDAVLIVKRIQQIRRKANIKTWLSFVDLTAAFDTLNREKLRKILNLRLPPNMKSNNLNLIVTLYSHTTAFISNDPDQQEFITNAGVRQGGSESPMLYNLYISNIPLGER